MIYSEFGWCINLNLTLWLVLWPRVTHKCACHWPPACAVAHRSVCVSCCWTASGRAVTVSYIGACGACGTGRVRRLRWDFREELEGDGDESVRSYTAADLWRSESSASDYSSLRTDYGAFPLASVALGSFWASASKIWWSSGWESASSISGWLSWSVVSAGGLSRWRDGPRWCSCVGGGLWSRLRLRFISSWWLNVRGAHGWGWSFGSSGQHRWTKETCMTRSPPNRSFPGFHCYRGAFTHLLNESRITRSKHKRGRRRNEWYHM